jgi:hypothetical protein
MLLARTVRLVSVTAMLARSAAAVSIAAVSIAVGTIAAVSTPAAAAGPALDVTPVLTSTPFASPPGQRVTHTIMLSATGTGALTTTRVTFTTTVALDGVTATPSAGSCPIVTPLTVVCELGNVDFSDADSSGGNSSGGSAATVPKVTITGTVNSGAAPGTLVQNLVNVTSSATDSNPANNVASNAYLVAGASAAPIGGSSSTPARASSGTTPARGINPIPVAAVLALAALAMIVLIVVRRRRS